MTTAPPPTDEPTGARNGQTWRDADVMRRSHPHGVGADRALAGELGFTIYKVLQASSRRTHAASRPDARQRGTFLTAMEPRDVMGTIEYLAGPQVTAAVSRGAPGATILPDGARDVVRGVLLFFHIIARVL